MNLFTNREARKWIYGICLTLVPIAIALGYISESLAPAIIAFAGAVLAPTLALNNLTPPKAQDPPQ